MQPINRGLLHEEIVEGKDGVFGSAVSYAGTTIIAPNGQWNDVENERQSSIDFDTFSCVAFGMNTQEEMYMKQRYGIEKNHSDRFLSKVSDTQPNGNTPQKVYETRRKKGFVFETEWPWPESVRTWIDYMAEIPQRLLTLALARSAEWRFWHDYVAPSPESIKAALPYSPVAVGVALMPVDNSLPQEQWVYYRPEGWQDTHWAVIRGYYENGDWNLKDTYAPFDKRVRANTPFFTAKIIEIDKQVSSDWWFLRFIEQIKALLGF